MDILERRLLIAHLRQALTEAVSHIHHPLRLELAIHVKRLLILVGLVDHLGRNRLQPIHQILLLIHMDQQCQPRLTPDTKLGVQIIIPGKHIWPPRLQLWIRLVHELAPKHNHPNTTPRATIHGVNRRQPVTHHKELARNPEALLVLKETTSLHHILARKLLHPGSVQRLTVIRLLEVNEPLVLDADDIRIRRTRIRTLPRERRGRQRRAIVTEGIFHQIHHLGFAVTTHPDKRVVTLLPIRPLQTTRHEPNVIHEETLSGKDLTQEIHELLLNGVIRIIRMILNWVRIRIVPASQETHVVIGLAWTKHHRLLQTPALSVIDLVVQVNHAVLTGEQILVHVQQVREVLLAEQLCRLLHHTALEIAGIQMLLQLVKLQESRAVNRIRPALVPVLIRSGILNMIPLSHSILGTMVVPALLLEPHPSTHHQIGHLCAQLLTQLNALIRVSPGVDALIKHIPLGLPRLH